MKGAIKERCAGLKSKLAFCFGHNRIKKGRGNRVTFGKGSHFRYCGINIQGKNNSIVFGDNCHIRGTQILVEGNDNYIEIGEDVIINASPTHPTVINAVGGKSIKIGKGSMISKNVDMHTSDYHGVYDKNGVRVNSDKDIIIGEYVWVGLGCKLLKGTQIANGSVVGAASLVTGVFPEENVIIAGNPAKVIRRQIFWANAKKDAYTVPEDLKTKWDRLDE